MKENFPGKVVSAQLREVGNNKIIYDIAVSGRTVLYTTFDEALGQKAIDLAEMADQPDSLFKTTTKQVPKKDGDGFWENNYLDAIEELTTSDEVLAEAARRDHQNEAVGVAQVDPQLAEAAKRLTPSSYSREDPEKTARIARQNATSTAFNFMGMVYTVFGDDPEQIEIATAHALEIARKIYAITMQEVPSGNGQTAKAELPTW